MAPSVYKRPRIDESNNEEQDLDEYEGEFDRYVPLPPAPLFPLPQKELNRSSDLDEGTMSLTHLVCIPKTASQKIANFASEFPDRGGLKPKKKFYTSRLRKGLEAHSASIASIASGTTNHRRLIRERLESHPPSNHRQGLGAQPRSNQRHELETRLAVTSSSSFTNASDIPDVIPHLLKHLARATLCGMDIVVVQGSKTQHLLPAVYANILGRWLLAWF